MGQWDTIHLKGTSLMGMRVWCIAVEDAFQIDEGFADRGITADDRADGGLILLRDIPLECWMDNQLSMQVDRIRTETGLKVGALVSSAKDASVVLANLQVDVLVLKEAQRYREHLGFLIAFAHEMNCQLDYLGSEPSHLPPASWQDGRGRCQWVTSALLRHYHDTEWGLLPETNARWFEFVVLETFQAGLSWNTILRKRKAFRRAFRGFVPEAVAGLTDVDIAQLMRDANIVRNRKKIEAAVENARIAVHCMDKHGSLDSFFRNDVAHAEDILHVIGKTFRFCGRTTAESIAFATGLVTPPHDPCCHIRGTENRHA